MGRASRVENDSGQPIQGESIMRLLIDTDGIQFRVAGPAKAKPDYKDK